MVDPSPSAENDKAKSSNNRGDELAAARTVLAMDRTLLAWIRTALSLIGFGLALVKFLGRHSLQNIEVPRHDAHSIEWIGLGIMTCGLICLISGAIDYYKAAHQLRVEGFGVKVWSRSMIMCLLLSVVTLGTIIAIVVETLH